MSVTAALTWLSTMIPKTVVASMPGVGIPFISVSGVSTAISGLSLVSTVGGMMQQSASMDYQAAVYRNQAIAARQEAEYKRQVAERNKVILGYQTENTKAQGEIAKKRSRLQAQSMIGRQRSALAHNNVVVDEGSAFDLQNDTYDQSIYDQALTDSDTAYAVHGHKLKEQELSQSGIMAVYEGNAKASSLQAKAAQTRSDKTGMILDNIGTVADKWYRT